MLNLLNKILHYFRTYIYLLPNSLYLVTSSIHPPIITTQCHPPSFVQNPESSEDRDGPNIQNEPPFLKMTEALWHFEAVSVCFMGI